MAESYGYYSYGDVKAKWLQGTPSMGSTLNNPNTQMNLVSKNAFSSKTEISKDYDTSESFLTVSKNVICNGTPLVKSANIMFNTTEMDVESKEYPTRIHDTKTIVVNTTDIGFYEITSVGQIARHDLTIIPTPSESIVKIYDVEQSSYNGYETEEVPYEVSCDGYTTKSGNIKLIENTEMEVVLKLQALLTVNVEQEDAVVIVNGVEGREHILGQGDEVTVEITCERYKPYTNTFIIEEDTVLDVVLELMDISIVFPGTTLPSSVTYSSSSFSNSGSYLYSTNTSHSSTGWAYLQFTTPNRATTLSVQAYTSSESNWDFGAVYVGTAIYRPTSSNIKSGTTDGKGTYLYRGSGSNSSYSTYTMTLSANTTYYINLVYSKDSSGASNSDRFYVKNITFTAKG